MATTTVTSSGSGVGVVYPGQPMMSISDTLFIFDLTPDSLEYFKTLCEKTKWNTVTVYQVQRFTDLKIFERALRDLIKYVIFKNQSLCEKVMVLTKDPKYTEVVNRVWPEEQKAITKFRGRKWPTENFTKEFTHTEGSGVVSISPDKMDPNDILSWFWEYEYSEAELSDGPYEYDHEDPDSIPIPLDDEVTELPDPIEPTPPTGGEDDSGGDDEGEMPLPYDNITYYYMHEYTVFPLQESHAIPAGNMTSAFTIPQNTITVDASRMHRVVCVLAYEDSGGGGDDPSSGE